MGSVKKYKLIKEYPGSPALWTVALPYTDSRDRVVHYIVEHTRKDCDYLALPKKHIEDNPYYWEEFEDNIWWLVFTEDCCSFKPWEPIRVETDPYAAEDRRYFKTKEEAEYFILYNKPCLSINEIGNSIPCTTLDRLIRTVKSKL
jgi:hypothetical protein